METLQLLSRMYDIICSDYDVTKLVTVGDASMMVAGCPQPTAQHADVIAHTALTLIDRVKDVALSHIPEYQLRVRIGKNET